MRNAVLTVVAFVIVTLSVQGLSHFAINADHFASIPFVRAEPIMPLGFAVMVIQALIFSFVMSRLFPNGATIQQALMVSGCFGLFLGSYIALTEPAKYAAPSIAAWITVESVASITQFLTFGLLLGLIYKRKATS